MKFDLNDNAFWFLLWTVVAGAILAAIITGTVYGHNKNKLILQADTCEKAALIDGLSYTSEIALCKIK